jgi:hypothetical protein
MQRALLCSSLLTGAAIAACVVKSDPQPAPGGGGEVRVRDHRTGHHSPVGTAEIVDEGGRAFQIDQGEPGDPSAIGCADGQREAFASAGGRVAGCIAEWSGTMSMRAPGTGQACGDDLGLCAAPADACAPGWHLCGVDGSVDEVAAIGASACESAGGGRFVAAISHCKTQSGCEYDQAGAYECFESGWCSEPVCCGSDCENGVCTGGVWADPQTHIAIGTDQGCGAIGSSRARGVLCCQG